VKALVVGSGGREHTLAWSLLRRSDTAPQRGAPRITEVVCVPGNGGTASLPHCRNLAMNADDFEGIAALPWSTTWNSWWWARAAFS
jgi:phosphoribosylamine--glycine ligase